MAWSRRSGRVRRRTRPPARTRRFRRLLLAGAAAVVGVGTFWGTGMMSGGTALTTSQIAAQTDPGLVDIVTTLGYPAGPGGGHRDGAHAHRVRC